MDTKDVDTKPERRCNKRWPEALKREIVAASWAPGASVSVVARQYDVNANQVFGWRKRYPLAATAPATPLLPAPAPSAARLVPVTITPEPETASRAHLPGSSGSSLGLPPGPPSETIEIDIGGATLVRVGSAFDSRTLERVLDVLDRVRGTRGCGR